MSIKSLGTASLGLLKRGIKATLHIASLGLLRIDPDRPVTGTDGDGFVVPGRMILNRYSVQANNQVILLSELSGVF